MKVIAKLEITDIRSKEMRIVETADKSRFLLQIKSNVTGTWLTLCVHRDEKEALLDLVN